MPQVDVEVFVTACAGGDNDRKIICETVVGGGVDSYQPNNDDNSNTSTNELPDFPPESFCLPKDAEYDWYDRYAFYERKESTKGNSNSTNSNVNPGSNSNSQRFSANLKSKASIIGLPKTQKTTYVDSRRRSCKPANIRLIPKRTESIGRTVEPSSPKVSCMGRVRSKRCRRRSNSLKKKEKARTGGEKEKTGFYSKVVSLFRSKKNRKKQSRSRSGRVEEEPTVVEPVCKSASVRVREISNTVEPVAEPPGLGGVMRFASGRRSQSWFADDNQRS